MAKQTEKLKSNESSFNEDPEHVHFYSDGFRLSGQFTRAKGPGVGKRSPTIVCLHGYTGRKEIYLTGYPRAFKCWIQHIRFLSPWIWRQ